MSGRGRALTFICGAVLFVAIELSSQLRSALANDFDFQFASVSQGSEIITRRDEYIGRMTSFDRSARVKTDREVSEAEYLRFLQSQVGEWSDSEKAALLPILNTTKQMVASLELRWPDTILLIKIDGTELPNTRYTRANSIVLPQSDITNSLPSENSWSLYSILAHELFHILSRYNLELRERLHAAIGFRACGEVVLPPSLAAIQITNPDAPINDHCISVKLDGTDILVMPLLLSKHQKFDLTFGRNLIDDYMKCSFLRIPESEAAPFSRLALSAYHFESVERLMGFSEQVGRNFMGDTECQPEEILADNFSFLVRGITNVPSPGVQAKIKEVFENERFRQ